MKFKELRKNWLDVCGLIVACIALITSVVSLRQTREHDRLSVVPYVIINDHGPHIKYKETGDSSFEIFIRNNGAGVAKLTSVEMTSSLTPSRDSAEILRVIGIVGVYSFIVWEKLPIPYYLREGDKVPLFFVDSSAQWDSPAQRKEQLNDLAQKTRSLKIVIKYESIYGQPNTANWSGSGN
jgi:hypothetical protein